MNASPHRRNPPGVAILRRWRSVLIGLGFASAAVVLCYEPIKVDGGGLEFQVTSAFAKEGNNGNGRGGGNGKGSSNAGGQGKGKGSDNAGGSAGSGAGAGAGSSQRGRSSDTPAGSARASNASLGASRIGVTHRNGFRETLIGGRYKMLDAKGRTIIDRPAVQSDLARLRRLTQ